MARMLRKKIRLENNNDRLLAKWMLQYLDRDFYMRSLGFQSFPWQKTVLNSKAKRKVVNGARQSGKSTIVSGVPAHAARFYPGSLSIIGAPTENQANETMLKVMSFIKNDPDYPSLRKCSTEEIMLENGSRIIVRTAKSGTFRGYSKPRVIILDEASRIDTEAYTSGVRPMLTDNPDCELILISTPFGREGFFYDAMNTGSFWQRFEVRSPFMPVSTPKGLTLVPYMNESDYQEEMRKKNVRAWYSPRHKDFNFQCEQLEEMHESQYLQEYDCEFIEKSGQVFSYDAIERMFDSGEYVLLLDERSDGLGEAKPMSFFEKEC